MIRETSALARRTGRVLGTTIDILDLTLAVERVLAWTRARESRSVYPCNVHVVVTASRDEAFRAVINSSDMAPPDGAPIAWMLRRLGFAGQPRVSGPDLMWALCARCAEEGVAVYFYGSTQQTLMALEARVRSSLPGLSIAGMASPPFRPLTEEEDADAVASINGSRPGIVFVGLGCPKQERWIAEHRGRIQAVMVGVGAAFDFHAGRLKRAPPWMRNSGLEWLHRLACEPRRLWKRYLVTNSIFVVKAARQLIQRE